MNYTQVIETLSTLTVIPSTDTDFEIIAPNAFLYAEGRITRDLDLMAANVTDASASTVALNRNFNIPTTLGTFLIVDSINVITPASTAPDSGTRVPLTPVSRDFLNMAWPSTTGATVPQYFAYVSQNTQSSPTQTQIIFGPWPDTTYRVEVNGKIQPATLSATNTTTWISENLSELFIAGCMVYFAGFMKNYGGQSDDPRQGLSWEKTYQDLLASAGVYEARKRFSGASWSPKQIEPQAQAQRG